ncbi:hypothetical protein [Vampirovibrio chlorellavorus]|uniref:hypothetical protein n=1 Tax=Vampirovibrio chlorellavorus TaxID=758823 RepID=UPI0026E9BD35|nr:hypothetical protein [Vampirovibrio chlorellavorus]
MSSNSTNNFHFSPVSFVAGLSAGSGASLPTALLATMSTGYLSRKLKEQKNSAPASLNQPSPLKYVGPNPYGPQNDVFSRKSILFGSGEGSSWDGALDESDAAATAAGWGLNKLDKFLVADKERYAKVRKFGPSQNFFVGDQFLSNAKHAADKRHYYNFAEEKMLLSLTETSAETQKARAYRRAAIAAKMKGDTTLAKQYMKQAKSARWAAEGPSSSSEPAKDTEELKKNDFFVNKVTLPVKVIGTIPLLITEGLAKCFMDSVFKTNLLEREPVTCKLIEVVAPFQCAMEKALNQLEEDYNEIARAGEESDEEWINDNDPKLRGASTGKGLRHKFL